MIWIDKNLDNEPQEFVKWKSVNLVGNWLEKYSPRDWWKKMRAETTVRKALQESLLNEQRHICCYCCRKISIDQNLLESTKTEVLEDRVWATSIEHLKEKSEPNQSHKMFDFDNLLISCASSSYCNEYRGKQSVQALFIDPTNQVLVEQISIKLEGKYLFLHSENADIKFDLDNKLNLNDINLASLRRKKAIKIQEEFIKTFEEAVLEIQGELTEEEIKENIKSDIYTNLIGKENRPYNKSFPFVIIWAIANL